jgi:hypothetical protein
MAIVNAKTPEERQVAQREYDQVIAVERRGKETDGEGKIPTANSLITMFSRTAKNAVEQQFGSMVQSKQLIIDTAADGSSTIRYIGTDADARARVNDVARNAMRSLASIYLDMNGRPQNRDVEAALRASGIEFDEEGRPLWPGLGPRRPTPPAQNNQVDRNNPLLNQ